MRVLTVSRQNNRIGSIHIFTTQPSPVVATGGGWVSAVQIHPGVLPFSSFSVSGPDRVRSGLVRRHASPTRHGYPSAVLDDVTADEAASNLGQGRAVTWAIVQASGPLQGRSSPCLRLPRRRRRSGSIVAWVIMHLLGYPRHMVRQVCSPERSAPRFRGGLDQRPSASRPLSRRGAAGHAACRKAGVRSSQGFSPACPQPSFARSGLPGP
jgi:hypothetical protein